MTKEQKENTTSKVVKKIKKIIKKEKKTGLSPEEEKLKLEAEIKQTVNETFNLDGDDTEESGDSDNKKHYEDYETKKLILLETLDEKNNLDLTNLNEDEIEDIENAFMLNMIFGNPLIQNVCNNHLRLKRSLTSDPKNLLQHLFEWSSGSLADLSSSNPITRVLGRKGAK